LISGQIQLHIGGLAIEALYARCRESITPQVLHVLHMLRIVSQFTNQSGIVLVGVLTERLLPFQHDHCGAIRIGFLKDFAHVR
jgi:hypothetical protein